MSIPAHKVVGDQHKPGQVVFKDITLNDYIRRKNQDAAFEQVKQEEKLTFDEWYSETGWEKYHSHNLSLDDADSAKFIMQKAWNAALTKGKL